MAEEQKKTHRSMEETEVEPVEPPLGAADSEAGDKATDEIRRQLEETAAEELERLRQEEE